MAKKRRQRTDREQALKQSRESQGAVSPAGNGRFGAERPEAEAGEGGGRLKSRAFWVSSLILIISGYLLLHRVDPGGQNTWAVVSPAFLLTGYLLIIPAIMYTYRGKG